MIFSATNSSSLLTRGNWVSISWHVSFATAYVSALSILIMQYSTGPVSVEFVVTPRAKEKPESHWHRDVHAEAAPKSAAIN